MWLLCVFLLSRDCVILLFGHLSFHTGTWEASLSACYLLHASFLLHLFFDTEDGGVMYHRNVVVISKKQTVWCHISQGGIIHHLNITSEYTMKAYSNSISV
jgi:hypothetical protein